ncbi:aspartate aminotransferase family protein [Eubacterium pyruvativorans]|uniref:aspartate aminotransferase family protein n=1 Tax=Eubacterium pyruvativorans TaxID=155865 RepID=UPI0023EF8840|nr:acetylornithine/succinylornithine family transaminase [Eubacterium pyruvativorans]MCI5747840.1 acetylornithine/succinylornithine family transaminase [Eubacterium pyruvativorans]
MKLESTGYTAKEIKDMVNEYMIETYDRFDFVAERGEGMYLYDEKGTPYLDFYAGVAVNAAGNCNPAVVKAVQDQAKELMQTFNYPYTIPQALLAKKICTSIGMDKIFYQNTGTEANEAMIKMARKYGIEKYGPSKYHIVTAAHSFHGRTFGSMSATGQPDNACQQGFGPMEAGFSYARFNDLQSFIDACTEDTIAIMIEPVQGEGGVYPATKEFMTGLRKYCDEHHLLLLLDEVQSGWGRTGALMSYMNYGIKPDIVSMAKALGGGMPIGAICATKEVSKAFTAGSHGSTFGGHPVCCAAALAEIDELQRLDLPGNAKEVGSYFIEKLNREVPYIKEARGQGLFVGVEFDDTVDATEIKHLCFEKRLLITAIGDSIIRMVPPLIVTKEQCDLAVDIIKEAAVRCHLKTIRSKAA